MELTLFLLHRGAVWGSELSPHFTALPEREKGAAAQEPNPLALVKSYKQIQLDTEKLDNTLKQNEEQMFSESLQFVARITLNPVRIVSYFT